MVLPTNLPPTDTHIRELPGPSYDTRDVGEHADVATILGVLPRDHPARETYASGPGTIKLTHLVADRPELVERLKMALLAGYRRLVAKSAGFRT